MTNSIQFKSIQFNKYMQNIFCKTPDGIAISWLIRQSPHVVYAKPFCEIPTESPPADSFVIGITMYMHNHFAKHPTESLSADSFIIGITEIVTGRMAFSTAHTLLDQSSCCYCYRFDCATMILKLELRFNWIQIQNLQIKVCKKKYYGVILFLLIILLFHRTASLVHASQPMLTMYKM